MQILIRYLLLLAGLMYLGKWLTRKSDPSFGWGHLTLALTVKIAAASAYGWVFLHYYGGDDTWMINESSIEEYHKLMLNPLHFLDDLNPYFYIHEFGWRYGMKVFFDNVELGLLVKPLSIINIWTEGNYFINIVFISFLFFWGPFFLYQVFCQLLPDFKWFSYCVIFLYPPTTFWLSGLRGDGLLFLFFALTLYDFQRWLKTQYWRYILYSLLWIMGVAACRISFAGMLIPALIAWWLINKKETNALKKIFLVYGGASIIFWITAYIGLGSGLPGVIIQRQAEFMALSGNTRVDIDILKPNPLSFITALPKALDNVFLRPYPMQVNGLLQWLVIAQNFFLICVLFASLWLWVTSKKHVSLPALWLPLLFFSLTIYLSIGYTIPFPGAAVRYRAIPELCLFLLASLLIQKQMKSNYFFSNVYKNNKIPNKI